jgi:hypothetical protein
MDDLQTHSRLQRLGSRANLIHAQPHCRLLGLLPFFPLHSSLDDRVAAQCFVSRLLLFLPVSCLQPAFATSSSPKARQVVYQLMFEQ